ncbi:hypothetical protein NBO_13g0024 [Nosema bombycis CQ1]|uniref:Trm112p-like protein n=1 Tax=Nosema bombycis (strain CQ1 / CVCC 102059) TaxID=578461 RepID=R0KXB7_NOSB1|nr:hypothetical protein NBO_1436g0001 [Nosema bombycis CQ1]EOB14847.1 hypothetical protein NBO_13g0024 [Nosema bombycis CQ1]|eukprot:EOB11211.1 hypothetical protein NBO_1436g0001 [Nosema bombycis CQ1]
MKPFLLGILKCKHCPFTSQLDLEVEEVKELDECFSLDVMKKEEIIRKIVKGFKINEFTEEDIKEYLERDNEKVSKLLFGTDVVKGRVTCMDCKVVYPIEDSILDTVDTK